LIALIYDLQVLVSFNILMV